MDLSANVYSTSTIAAAAACLGAVLVGVYVVWGPDFFFRKKGQCPGLINLGNTCFMNAVLQGLAALPPVREWLTATVESTPGPLATALNEVLTVLSEEREGVHSPSLILHALRHHRWSIDFQQQDAHELYHVMLTTLTEEMTPCPSLLSELEQVMETSVGGVTKTRSVAWTRAGCVPSPEKPLKCPLQGLLTSELICCTCHYTSPMQYEMFDSLSLSLPNTPTQCFLQSCMADYVKSEVVQEVECPQCSLTANKKIKRRFYKRLQLGRPPDCLCIHFKRTVWLSNGQLHKDDTYVSFPTRLDITQFIKSHRNTGSTGCGYKLCAVTEHLGGPFSGHYQTFRRVGERHWVRTSDTAVYSTTVHEVTSCTAFMLFYSRSRT